MIRFNCHCTHEFLVPEDQAGGMVQCPKCSRLNDIPTLSDLNNLEADGSFKIGAAPDGPDKHVLPTATRAFTHAKQDDSGEDIDMRPGVEEFLNVGAEEIPLALAGEELPGAPKYDPLTGELIETLQIKPSDEPTPVEKAKIPVARRAVTYAADGIPRRVTPGTILLHLFQPVNLFVMACVVFAHVLFQCALSIVMAGIFFAAPLLIIIAALIQAHYGIIIEEIGTSELDELPRPLRDASFSEDIWRPWIRVSLAVMLCFWPEIWTLRPTTPVGWGLLISCTLFGIYFFPAVLMTALNGDTYLNLRLDRVIGVIRACGLGYWVSVVAFAIAGSIYLGSVTFVNAALTWLFGHGAIHVPLIGLSIATPSLLIGIYLMHFACWHLGLLYRANHDKFPWILQRHVRTRRTDTIAQLEAARKAAMQHDALKKNRPDRDQRLAELREAEKAKHASKTDAKPIWDRVAEGRE